MNQKNIIPSPCIRKCSLDEQEICRGCYRSIVEIVGWETMNGEQRQQTLQSCRQRRAERAAKCRA